MTNRDILVAGVLIIGSSVVAGIQWSPILEPIETIVAFASSFGLAWWAYKQGKV